MTDRTQPLGVWLMHEHSWPSVQRGGERYLHDIGWFLHHHSSIDADVLTASGRPRTEVIGGVPVHRSWPAAFSPLGRISARAPRLSTAVSRRGGRRALTKLPVSLVHALSPNAALAAIDARLPTVFTTVGTPDGAWAARNARRWAATETAGLSADAVTAVGEAAADGFAAVLGRPVLALQPGIRLESFAADLTPRTSPPRILFASAVTAPNKGFAAVLQAFADVVEAHPEAELVVLGPGDVDTIVDDASPSVRRRVRPRIRRWVPRPSEMATEYARCTMTVLASSGEAFGMVLAESLAGGTPIVASDVGGPAEILGAGTGVIGHAATPHDPDSIADALLRTVALAAEPDTPRRCRERARSWDWIEEIGPRHVALYRSVLEQR